MTERYIVFDVETPNSMNNRMSAIGITVIENGIITKEFSSLVNPQQHFDYFNINLTGITPEMTETAPTFPELWEQIGSLMESGILVAHNAPFDMGVLAKCVADYGVKTAGAFNYVCTCRMARKCLPQLSSHRLNVLCNHLGISLQHHDAASDSTAAAKIFIHCTKNGINPQDFLKTRFV